MSQAHDAFHARGRRAVLAHQAIREEPPNASSPRWGVSLVLRPDDGAARRLAELAAQAAAVAGPGHWQTGSLGSAHLTVRVLEPFREPVPLDDPLVRRYGVALSRVADRTGSPLFAMTGLLVAVGGVVAAAEPANASATHLRAVVSAELGGDGGFEEQSYRGDVWWSTLLHFAAPLADGAALVDWVDERRALEVGPFQARSLDLVRYEHDGVRTAPVVLASVPLGS